MLKNLRRAALIPAHPPVHRPPVRRPPAHPAQQVLVKALQPLLEAPWKLPGINSGPLGQATWYGEGHRSRIPRTALLVRSKDWKSDARWGGMANAASDYILRYIMAGSVWSGFSSFGFCKRICMSPKSITVSMLLSRMATTSPPWSNLTSSPLQNKSRRIPGGGKQVE